MIQIYTGDGKGKTTTAIGQGIRAVGSGMNVIMVQFLKGGKSSELNLINKIDNFNVVQFEKERDFFWNLNDEEKEELRKEVKEAYTYCCDIVKNNKCDMLILDEVMGVLSNKLLDENDILNMITLDTNVEIILTGRNAPKEIVERADLVTEMKCIKHYFDKGIEARKGIEY